jgi:cardiolipin synthase
MEELIRAGCRLWYSGPSFDHSKLLAIDDAWGLIGSANWDERSLRLNFELNVECYDGSFARALHGLVDAKRDESEPVTLNALRQRTMPIKLRDGVARLFAPYL